MCVCLSFSLFVYVPHMTYVFFTFLKKKRIEDAYLIPPTTRLVVVWGDAIIVHGSTMMLPAPLRQYLSGA